jgi:3D (Asp-Asp-Asp) domain-containing protein
MKHAEFQSVRTTAYTHTEADHTAYSNHNALGGRLQAASPPSRRAENTRNPLPAELAGDRQPRQSFSLETRVVTKKTKESKTARAKKAGVTKTKVPCIGSAAADWSRWPAGTTFRVLSTGQKYRVEDYGWALSGRNTIDLYMATPRDMNSWGMREEKIQVLRWGNPQESLRLLRPHQASKHIRRMILELEGQEQEAAALQ